MECSYDIKDNSMLELIEPAVDQSVVNQSSSKKLLSKVESGMKSDTSKLKPLVLKLDLEKLIA